MSKTIQCLSCRNIIAKENNGKIIFPDMKSISIIELDRETTAKDVKCRCGAWNSFTQTNEQSINYKRKSQDALYNSENVIFKTKI